MRDAYVFPGGAVDAVDGSAAAAAALHGSAEGHEGWHAAALRELAEEAGVFITSPEAGRSLSEAMAGKRGEDLFRAVVGAGFRFDASALKFLSNWVTPPGPPRRFDARFYVAGLPARVEPSVDGVEVTDALWISPHEALARADKGSWKVPFPTRTHLEMFTRFATVEEVLAYAENQEEVPRVEPRLVETEAGEVRLVVPGLPGTFSVPDVEGLIGSREQNDGSA